MLSKKMLWFHHELLKKNCHTESDIYNEKETSSLAEVNVLCIKQDACL